MKKGKGKHLKGKMERGRPSDARVPGEGDRSAKRKQSGRVPMSKRTRGTKTAY